MTRSARETIELFWETQNGGDFTAVIPLFAEDAVLEDPVYGRFEGRAAIADFMAKMEHVLGPRNIHFTAKEIAGGGDIAWARWVAHNTDDGDVEGCGLYRVKDGLLTYYCDYMNEPDKPA